MFAFKARAKQADVLYAAFDALPHPAMTPRAAFQRLMAGMSFCFWCHVVCGDWRVDWLLTD